MTAVRYSASRSRSARCETCNAPIGPTDMQYWTGGAVWCEAHAPAWAFDEDNTEAQQQETQ